jgi:hypothetical protein
MTTQYIKLSTLQYPLYEGDIRLEHPEIREDQTHPNFPCPNTFALVEVDPMPDFDPTTHHTKQLPPENINGTWKVRWTAVRELTDSEKQFRQRRRILDEAVLFGGNNSPLFANLDSPGEAPNVL